MGEVEEDTSKCHTEFLEKLEKNVRECHSMLMKTNSGSYWHTTIMDHQMFDFHYLEDDGENKIYVYNVYNMSYEILIIKL